MMRQQMQKFYSTRHVAERLSVTPATVARWIRNGELRAIKIGRVWRVSDDALRDFIATRGVAWRGGI